MSNYQYKYIGGKKVEINATKAIVKAIMQYQKHDDTFGTLFTSLYCYCDQLSQAHFQGELPTVILSFSSNDTIGTFKEDSRKGSFVSQDGLCLPFRINLNLSAMKNGIDAAEVLTHELVHAWQFSKDIWNTNNYHDMQWHEKMNEIGINTESRFGDTVDFNSRWKEWMEECKSLHLSSFILPGAANEKEQQQQLVFTKKEDSK